jgi:hypothetical protein
MSTFFYKSSLSVTPIERVTLLDGTTTVDQLHSVLDKSLSTSKDAYWAVTDGGKLKIETAYSLTDATATSLIPIFSLTTEYVYTMYIVLHKKAVPGATPTCTISIDGGGVYAFYLNGDGDFAALPMLAANPANVKLIGTNATVDIAILVNAI